MQFVYNKERWGQKIKQCSFNEQLHLGRCPSLRVAGLILSLHSFTFQ